MFADFFKVNTFSQKLFQNYLAAGRIAQQVWIGRKNWEG